ncbi:MAG: mechanosensitive ion channel family protein [Desulfobacterales bacterium]
MILLEKSFFGNTMQSWLIAGGIAFLGTLLLYSISKIFARSLRAIRRRVPEELAEGLASTADRTKFSILLIISVYAAAKSLTLPDSLMNTLRFLTITFGGLQIGIWASHLSLKLVAIYIRRREDSNELASARGLINLVVRVIIWSAAVLLVLDNLGFTITTLVAGLGVGGIAVAMASQTILADLFASLSILLDKPFKVGEFIIIDDRMGTVENIGLKTTRIRSLSGEELIFSNTDLLASRIRNYKTMRERRVVFTIGVEYSTPYEKVARIPRMIQEAIQSTRLTRFDRSHFFQYGDFSLNVETVYYVLSSDYNVFMDIQQEINLKIFKRFSEEDIVFAFPTRTIHLKSEAQANPS